MKRILNVLLILMILNFSCEDDAHIEPELIGTWELVEEWADPGNGSGTFRPIESDKQITFTRKGKVISNGTLCEMSSTTEDKSRGKYELESSTIILDDCNTKISLSKEDQYLILGYLYCIEPCAQKYRKLTEE
jgi:hypothetical protein